MIRAVSVRPVPRQITRVSFRVIGPTWSPDSDYLYATRPGATNRIMGVPVNGGEVEDLFDGHTCTSNLSDAASIMESQVLPESFTDYIPPRGFSVNHTGIFYVGRDFTCKPEAIRFFEFPSGKSYDLAPQPGTFHPSR